MGQFPVEYARQSLLIDQQIARAEVAVQEHTGCLAWRMVNEPVEAELHHWRDVAKRVQPFLRCGKAFF